MLQILRNLDEVVLFYFPRAVGAETFHHRKTPLWDFFKMSEIPAQEKKEVTVSRHVVSNAPRL